MALDCRNVSPVQSALVGQSVLCPAKHLPLPPYQPRGGLVEVVIDYIWHSLSCVVGD